MRSAVLPHGSAGGARRDEVVLSERDEQQRCPSRTPGLALRVSVVTRARKRALPASEAIELCNQIRPRLVVPVHYEGWSSFRQGRAAAERVFAGAPMDVRERVRWLTPGITTDLGDGVASTG